MGVVGACGSCDVDEAQLQPSMNSVAPGSSMELACLHIGSLQVQQERELAFMCGSLLVPTGAAVHSTTLSAPAVVQSQRMNAPRYRLLPTETDLNSPPSQGSQFEHMLPVKTPHDPGGLCNARGEGQSLSSLALSALLDYGDTIDVVAPVDILKQIFKTPYSKARLSVGVHRIGQTLVLCNGPDTEEGETVVRRKKSQSHGVESKLFSKFVQHSVNGHSSDSRTAKHRDSDSASNHHQGSHINAEEEAGVELHSSVGLDCCFPWQVVQEHPSADDSNPGRDRRCPEVPAHSCGNQKYPWENCRRGQQSNGINSLNDVRAVGEQQQNNTEYLQNEADGHQRPCPERFLRVLYWEFKHMRMLLGSDLLVFSNEKHAAVSLHLLEIDRQVAPLVWLDAWLDNVMASIPELAVCYHRKGVVQGYELLKTEDIFLVKGLSKDGTITFHPHVVQQNASSILRFLQDNCKRDPGTYWLFKNAGEDHMHLFDLSAISKNRSTRAESDQSNCGTLPSVRMCSKGRYALPLAMLLYRLAHSFSHSQNAADQGKCVNFFEKCLEFMDEQEHLVVRSSAHEHLGRVWLNCLKELGLPLQSLLLGNVVVGLKKSPLVLPSSATVIQDASAQSQQVYELTENDDCLLRDSVKVEVGSGNCSYSQGLAVPPEDTAPTLRDCVDLEKTSTLVDIADSSQLSSAACFDEQSSDRSETFLEPGSSGVHVGDQRDLSLSSVPTSPLHAASAALTAVHHISQAIKALRWQRKLDDVGAKGNNRNDVKVCLPCNFSGQVRRHQQMTICVCGEVDCIPLCDIKDPELRYRMDHKLWRLVLMLGESYLALGQAYKDAGELTLALRAAELACLVRSCIPQRTVEAVILNNEDPVYSRSHQDMQPQLLSKAYHGYRKQSVGRNGKHRLMREELDMGSSLEDMGSKERPGKGLFWGQLWMFIGDVYVERHRSACQPELSCQSRAATSIELKVIQDVAKEVKRLKKRVLHSKRNCNICSLISCSCQSERADSGSSASSSNTNKAEVSRIPSNPGKKSLSKKKSQDVVSRPESIERASSCETDLVIRKDEKGFHDVDIGPVDAPPLSSSKTDVHSRDEDLTTSICASVGDMSSYFRPPVATNWESTLLSSVNCYQAADLAFQGFWDCVQERELALRKKGWAANELGRRRLQLGNVTSAYESFRMAIQAFAEVKDHTNVILVHCNLGHGHRASAENLVSRVHGWEESTGTLQQNVLFQAVVQAKRLYAESLREYNIARQELTKVGDGVERGLWNEVHTQLAHTYLKLGMLLAREEKLAFGGQTSGDAGRAKKSGSSATDSITKALVLYESLGSHHAHEAAYAQFQLACHEKNCCIGRLATQVEKYVKDKADNGDLLAVKRHAHLAELYWQKSMEFYRPDTHCDMFLEILMERSALCVSMAPLSHPNPVLDMALTHLLEGRRMQQVSVDSHGTCTQRPQPSAAVYTRFLEQLRALLKKMLAVAMNPTKHCSQKRSLKSDCPTERDPNCSTRRGADVLRVKEVYRHALSTEPDLGKLHSLWMA